MNGLQISSAVLGVAGLVVIGMSAGWLPAFGVALMLWGYGLQLSANAMREKERQRPAKATGVPQ